MLDAILQPEFYPKLDKDLYHKLRISYYPPRGGNKECWDYINGSAAWGWMGGQMQVKVEFLCKDSILAGHAAAGPGVEMVQRGEMRTAFMGAPCIET